MSRNLNTVPPKSILKKTFVGEECSVVSRPRCSNSDHKATFDEMNILETLHPPDKDYGHMKIDEPKTPFHNREDSPMRQESISNVTAGTSSALDPAILAQELERRKDEPPPGRRLSATIASEGEDDDDLDPESAEKRKKFEFARKQHYNEFYKVQLARKLMAEDDDDDDDGAPASARTSRGSKGGPRQFQEEDGNNDEMEIEIDRSSSYEDSNTNEFSEGPE